MNHRNCSVLETLKRFYCCVLIDYPRLHQHTGCDFHLGLDMHFLMRPEGECFLAFLEIEDLQDFCCEQSCIVVPSSILHLQ